MIDAWKHPEKNVRVALVGKYVSLHDAYISVVEALKHAGVANKAEVEIKWVDSELVTEENVAEILGDIDGILVPGGFGDRGIEGMITSINYARTHKVPYLGLCLGMQLTIVEFARNVLGYSDAHSSEFNPNSFHQCNPHHAKPARCNRSWRYPQTWFISLCACKGFKVIPVIRYRIYPRASQTQIRGQQ